MANDTTHPATERHYTVAQVAELWGMGTDSIYRIFSHADGVLRFNANGARKSKTRGYVSMRIPESVLQRVHAALCQPDDARRKTTGDFPSTKFRVEAASSRSL